MLLDRPDGNNGDQPVRGRSADLLARRLGPDHQHPDIARALGTGRDGDPGRNLCTGCPGDAAGLRYPRAEVGPPLTRGGHHENPAGQGTGATNRGSGLPGPDPGREAPPFTLHLLRSFEVRRRGEAVSLPLSTQRLVAFLALRGRPLHRLHVAGTLPPA
jgi:hypothetical protein